MSDARNEAGHFKKGVSGNPSGKPKGYAEFQKKCRGKSTAAFNHLVKTMTGRDGPLALKAAEMILAYSWGKPSQTIAGEGGEGAGLIIVKRYVMNPEESDADGA